MEYGFNYIRRPNRPELKKAGNLRHAFPRTEGEFIVILDADFCPRADILKETIPYFANPDIAIVQSPTFFRHRADHGWVENGAGAIHELFYRMVQVNRDAARASICVGTCGIYRRAALDPMGGTAPIGHSEDVHTGFNCTIFGYYAKYIPVILAMGTCPDDPRAVFAQQYRWCMGSTTLLCNPAFWRSPLTWYQKSCYLSGMMYYSMTALSIFLNPLPGLLLIWVKPEAVLFYNIAFALPSMIFGSIVMRCWTKQPFGWACQRVRVIQYLAHLFALKDKLFSSPMAWVPTGGGASSRKASAAQRFLSAMVLNTVWVVFTTAMVFCGTAWRISSFPWYHFIPSLLVSLLHLITNLSILFHS